MKMEKCKHQCGWVVMKEQHIFVFPSKDVTVGLVGKKSRTKLLARCNNPSCNKSRNIYIKAKLIKFGKIITNKK